MSASKLFAGDMQQPSVIAVSIEVCSNISSDDGLVIVAADEPENNQV